MSIDLYLCCWTSDSTQMDVTGGSNNRHRREENIPKLFQQKHLMTRVEVDTVPIDTRAAMYNVDDFVTLRDKLNETKTKMDKFYIGSKNDQQLARKWWSLQSSVDLYKPLRFHLMDKYNAQLVTNAWMKYYEIYHQYKLIPEKSDRVYTAFFNAELPGAAVCAFNHFMQTLRPSVKFDWFASSLVPTTGSSSDALGDKYGLYAMNKSHWLMDLSGKGNTGDATVAANLEDFASRIGPGSKVGGVDLYSHDAGIDVSEGEGGGLGFNQQELANAKVHLGCAIAGFMTMRKGASFIAKQYTFFETFTWNLILIYASLFDEFYICKPLTSRPYNSEIYLVGKGFKGFDDKIKKALLERLANFNTNPFVNFDVIKTGLSEPFSEISRFSRVVFNQQIQFINENLELFDKYQNRIDALKWGLDKVRFARRDNWLHLYPVKKIEQVDWLPATSKTTG